MPLFQRIYKYLKDLLDVSVTSPTDGQVLKYQASSSKWVNGSASGSTPTLDAVLGAGNISTKTAKVGNLQLASGGSINTDSFGGIDITGLHLEIECDTVIDGIMQAEAIYANSNLIVDSSGGLTANTIGIINSNFNWYPSGTSLTLYNQTTGDNAFTFVDNGTSTSIVTGFFPGGNTLDDGNGNMIVSGTVTISADASASPTITTGSLNLQPYALNNGFITENCYFDGSQFVYQNSGSAGLFYFQGDEGQFRFFTSGSQGDPLPGGGDTPQFKVNADGTVAIGGSINNNSGNYSGATLIADGSGNVTISGSINLPGFGSIGINGGNQMVLAAGGGINIQGGYLACSDNGLIIDLGDGSNGGLSIDGADVSINTAPDQAGSHALNFYASDNTTLVGSINCGVDPASMNLYSPGQINTQVNMLDDGNGGMTVYDLLTAYGGIDAGGNSISSVDTLYLSGGINFSDDGGSVYQTTAYLPASVVLKANTNTTSPGHSTATSVAGSTTSVFTNTQFAGTSGSTAYTVNDLVTILKAAGILKA